MAPSPSSSCAACGKETRSLNYDVYGRVICDACEAAADAAKITKQGVIKTAVAPPGIALLGTLTLCLPYINLVAPPIAGVIAIFGAVGAIRLAMSGNAADGVTSSTKPWLFISGIVGGLWGLGLCGIGLTSWIACAAS
jgi:hypothetical protein